MSDPASNPESSRQVRSRRRFLKGGVALGAALVAGAGHPIAGGAQPAPDDPSKVLGGPLRPYGERSRFEQSVREKPPGGWTSSAGTSRPWTRRWGSSRRPRFTSWSNAAAFPTSTRASTVS